MLNKGFTLIEILVVVSIIGILLAAGVSSYVQAQIAGRDARRKTDMKAIQNAFEQYYMERGNVYPTSCSAGNVIQIISGATDPRYRYIIPTDPKNVTPYTYTPNCPAGGLTYCFCAQMEKRDSAGVGIGGNSSSNACAWANDGPFYCVKNRQ